MPRVQAWIVAVGLTVASCTYRTLPIPPPGESSSTADCSAALCPSGGVVVTVSGQAEPGALVEVENIDRSFADGRRYSASAWALQAASDAGAGDAGVPDGGPGTAGFYVVTLGPTPDSGGGVVVSQHGDHLQVSQFVEQSDGTWQQSMTVQVTVP